MQVKPTNIWNLNIQYHSLTDDELLEIREKCTDQLEFNELQRDRDEFNAQLYIDSQHGGL